MSKRNVGLKSFKTKIRDIYEVTFGPELLQSRTDRIGTENTVYGSCSQQLASLLPKMAAEEERPTFFPSALS